MERKMLIGGWDWNGNKEVTKGITLCKLCDSTSEIKMVNNFFPNVNVGSPVIVSKKGILYFVHETKDTLEKKHEGGYVLSAKLNQNNEIILLNYKKTYSPNPCYCTLDEKEEYLIVVHHASTRSVAAKMYRDNNGVIKNKVIHDDAAIDLFKLNEDGSIGDLIDYTCHEPIGQKMSLLHGVYLSSNKKFFIITDKGLDKIYSYRINDDKLEMIDHVQVAEFSHPRYISFHPQEKIFYGNNEKKSAIYIYEYNDEGHLSYNKSIELKSDFENEISGSSDLIVSSNGKNLYVVVRSGRQKKANEENPLYHIKNDRACINVFDLSDPLNPVFVQCVSVKGAGTRAMALDPSTKYLYTCDTDSNNITVFNILGNGRLDYLKSIEISHPGNITFIDKEEEDE